MVSDDTFRKRMNGFIAAIDAWATEMAPWATVEFGPTGASWRVRAEPKTATACPLEAVIRPDQKFDLMVGGEQFEDLPLLPTDVPKLLRAISEGHIMIRRWASAVTDLAYSVEAIVDLGDGDQWRPQRALADDEPNVGEELMAKLISFAPYRR